MIGFDVEYETRPGFWQSLVGDQARRRSEMVSMLNAVVQAVAYHGNVVIQGRSGFASLAGFADVLHVRLQAPLPTRIENIRTLRGLSQEEAAAVVTKGDEVRTAFVEDFYGVAWNAMNAFDLVINTAKVAPDEALTTVVDVARTFAATCSPANLQSHRLSWTPCWTRQSRGSLTARFCIDSVAGRFSRCCGW